MPDLDTDIRFSGRDPKQAWWFGRYIHGRTDQVNLCQDNSSNRHLRIERLTQSIDLRVSGEPLLTCLPLYHSS